MNENIDLTKILKDCSKGTKLYSTIHGEVSLITSNDITQHYPIAVKLNDKTEEIFTSEGKLLDDFDGECILFPSKEQRDWSRFTAPWYKKEKFDPKTLKAFDKVLVRNFTDSKWACNIFSNIRQIDGYMCIYSSWRYCIPYNDETKHLVGTTEEAPEYYKYWEE